VANIEFTLDNITSIEEPKEISADFELFQNYPNPFNPSTMINYQLPMINEVKLCIYNLLGQRVATLVNERKRAGCHQLEWDASNMASGAYLYRLEAGDYVETKKMILMR
ncbi:MAG: T9SS type A sorting domain-containing protein, partial [Promethearchaeota archaeon]